jgi:histidinol-phosphate aminotransferase
MKLVGAQFANFLLYRTGQKQALMDYLVANGLLIRDQSKQLYLENCLRITVGNREENQTLLALIQQFYQKGKAA